MFGYIELLKSIDVLDKSINVEVIGKSLFGRDIIALNYGVVNALIHGGIHAREHITAKLTFELAKIYKGYNISFVPLVNPDGAELCIRGIDTAPKEYREFLTMVNAKSKYKYDFSLWKANGRAVDLNVNFDADWGAGEENVRAPSSSGYIGEYPFSESESIALREYTLKNNILVSVSYHAKGEIIYYGYDNNNIGEDFAKKVSDATGYRLAKSIGSAGGYKDWFCNDLKRVGITIEVGDDNYPHPFPYSQFSDIISKNISVPQLVDKEVENEQKIYGIGNR